MLPMEKAPSPVAARSLFSLVLFAVLGGCISAKRDMPPKPLVAPVACTAAPVLGQLVATAGEPRPDQSGIRVLDTGREGFLARAALIEAASCVVGASASGL